MGNLRKSGSSWQDVFCSLKRPDVTWIPLTLLFSKSWAGGLLSMGLKWPVFEAPSHVEITKVYLHLHSTICPCSMVFKQAQTQLNLSFTR